MELHHPPFTKPAAPVHLERLSSVLEQSCDHTTACQRIQIHQPEKTQSGSVRCCVYLNKGEKNNRWPCLVLLYCSGPGHCAHSSDAGKPLLGADLVAELASHAHLQLESPGGRVASVRNGLKQKSRWTSI